MHFIEHSHSMVITSYQNTSLPPSKEESSKKVDKLIYLIQIFITIFIVIFSLYFLYSISIYYVTVKGVKYDVPAIKNALKNEVYGQDYAVSKIVKKLRRIVFDQKLNNTNPRLIFLLGGPGVGKHHVLNIIGKHIKSESPNEATKSVIIEKHMNLLDILKCYFLPIASNEWNYIEYDKGYSTPFYVNITNLEYYIKNPNNCNLGKSLLCNLILFPVKNNNNVYFLTGSIMTKEELIKFKYAADYEDYVEDSAEKLRDYMNTCAPELDVTVITFDALGPEDVKIFLQHKTNLSLKSITYFVNADTVNDFVPFGCKTNKDINV